MELSQVVQSIKNILETTLHKHCNDQNLQLALQICNECQIELKDVLRPNPDEPISRAWNEVIPKEFCEHAQPFGYTKGTLLVAVDSQIWLNEIVRYRRRELLLCLQAKLGSDVIQRVSYRINTTNPEAEFIFYVPSRLHGFSQSEHNPCAFGHAQKCISLAFHQVLEGKRFDVRFHEIEAPEEPAEPATPQTGRSVELHLEMLQSDLAKALMPYDASAVQRETLQSLALSLSNRFERIGARWWAAYKRAEELKDPLVGELRALGNFWYILRNSCDAVVGIMSDGTKRIAAGLSRLDFHPTGVRQLPFQAAELNWGEMKIAVIVVKSYVLLAEDEKKLFMNRFIDCFEGAHIVLAAQLVDGGVEYFGRTDLVQRLAEMNPKELSWREYRLPAE